MSVIFQATKYKILEYCIDYIGNKISNIFSNPLKENKLYIGQRFHEVIREEIDSKIYMYGCFIKDIDKSGNITLQFVHGCREYYHTNDLEGLEYNDFICGLIYWNEFVTVI